MSELITVNPGTPSTVPILGLRIINEQPVRIIRDNAFSPVVGIGSAGKDTFEVASSTNGTEYIISGDAGDDTIVGGAGSDIFAGNGGNDNITGGQGDDKLIGGVGSDRLQGNEGLDVIDAGLGDDTLRGDEGNDTLLGGPGDDELFGGANEDVLRGGDGKDLLSGGDGADTLRGGRGNDILVPGAGRDVMKGGFGSDTFRFEAGSTGVGQLDRIVDFKPSDNDRIELSASLLPGSGLGDGDLSDEDFEIIRDISLEEATATLVYEQKTGIVFYNPEDGKNVPLFQLKANLDDLSASNFTII